MPLAIAVHYRIVQAGLLPGAVTYIFTIMSMILNVNILTMGIHPTEI